MSIEDAEIDWLFGNAVDYDLEEDGEYDYFGNPINIDEGTYYKIGVEPDIVKSDDLYDYCVHELGLEVPDISQELDLTEPSRCLIALDDAGYSFQCIDGLFG